MARKSRQVKSTKSSIKEDPRSGAVRTGGVSKLFQFPGGIAPGTAQISLLGNSEAVIEGCQGIIEYEDSVIRLNIGRYILKITGDGLCIRCFGANGVSVEGMIFKVEYTN